MIRKKDLAIFNIASKDTTRPVLWAVKVNYIEEEKKLVFVATDGYQLTETVVRDLDYTPNFTEILIPNTDFEAAAKLAKASDHFEIYQEKFVVKDKDGVIRNELSIERLIEGTYPNYKGLIPAENKGTSLNIDIALLKNALKAHEGTLSIQVEVDPMTGGVVNLKPLSIRNSREDAETLSVVMPLKS